MPKRRSVRGDEDNWIETQCAVFKNWVNQNLAERDMELQQFETDFADGIKLINLYEVAAKKKLGRYTRKPKLPNQMLENVTLALKAMEDDGINLLSIDSEHIVNGSLKLILGLIWRMILHYQIGAMTVKIPVKKLILIWLKNVIPDQHIKNVTTDWNSGRAICALVEAIVPGSCPNYNDLKDEDRVENCRLGLQLAKEKAKIPAVITGEQMADPDIDEQSMITYFSYFIQDEGVGEDYAKNLVNGWSSELSFSNFNTDWNDGIRLCTLVEALAPGSLPHYKTLDPANGIENITLGMETAESKLGIQKILKPKEMANPEVTEIAVMVYLLQFRGAVSVPSTPPRPMQVISITEEEGEHEPVVIMEIQSPSRKPQDEAIIEPATVTEEQKEPEIDIALQSEPEIEIALQSEPEIEIVPESVVQEETEIDVTMVTEVEEPPIEEEAGVSVEAYLESAMTTDVEPEVFVESIEPEKPKVSADMFFISGAGLTDPQMDVINEFYIRCDHDFDNESLNITVTGPGLNAGDDDRDIPIQVERTNSSLVTCRYPLDGAGLYTVDVLYEGEHVNRSPVSIKIVQDLTRVTVSGSGLGHVFLHEPAELNLETGLQSAVIQAYTVSSTREELPAVVSNQGNGDYLIKYIPHHTGLYGLYISINGETLPGSPYVAKVLDPASVVVSSLQQKKDKEIYVAPDSPVALDVDVSQCESDYGTITASTVGPHNTDTPTQLIENDDGTLTFAFIPPTIGYYHTDILWNNRKLAGCPFIVTVSDPDKCVAHGEGLYQARLNEAAWFEVTTIGVGPGKLTASVECNGEDIPIEITKTDDYTYNGNYYPDSLNQITVRIAYNGVPIRGSPFAVKVGNPNKCKFEVSHPEPVKVGKEQSFAVFIDDEAGYGEVSCVVKGPCSEVPVMIIDTSKNTKRIDFRPKTAGMHEVKVYFAEALLAGCPYMMEVLSASDPSKIVVSGDGIREARVNEITKAYVDCKEAGSGELTANVFAQDTNAICPVAVKDNDNGTYDVTYSVPQPQAYSLEIKYDNEHVPGSPFNVNGVSKSDSSQVVLTGDGLKEGTTGQPVKFTLDGRNAGDGKLTCDCKSPSGKFTFISISDNEDGTYTVDLNATEPGVHSVNLEWDGKPVPGSPFLVRIMQAPDAGKVKVHGPGLNSGLLGDYEGHFSVETKGAGPGTLKVRIHGPKGAFKVEMFRESEKDRRIGVRYSPKEIGQYTINVLWSGEHAEGSPYHIYLAENKPQLDALINAAKSISVNGYEDKRV